MRDAQGVNYTRLNVLDVATMHNLILLCGSTKPSDANKVFKDNGLVGLAYRKKAVVDHGSEFLAYTSDNGIYQKVFSVEAPWQHGMVEGHGQVMADIIQATISETRVSGTYQMKDVLRMTSLAKNRTLCKTGYSPWALVYGLDEKLLASGLDHYLDKPDDAVISRNVPAHLRDMKYRKLALKAVITFDCAQR